MQSHIHALGQCRKIIRSRLKAVVAGDTAGAAREIAELGDQPGGARPAHRRRDLRPRHPRRGRRGRAHNTTRFIILAKNEKPAPPAGRVVTSFVFRVRNVPAALYKAMGGFATNGVNMTKLESYQLDGSSPPPSSTPRSKATPTSAG